jgi:hypothetical protein
MLVRFKIDLRGGELSQVLVGKDRSGGRASISKTILIKQALYILLLGKGDPASFLVPSDMHA